MSRFLKLALVLGMLFLTDTMTITAQNVAVKTNVLYWTTATFNASVETRLSSKWTLDVSAGYYGHENEMYIMGVSLKEVECL